MNKFSLALGLLGGFAGGIVLVRYVAAKNAADIRTYEEMDGGLYLDDEELPF